MLRTIIITAIRVVTLAVLYLVCFAVVSGALLATAAEQTPPAGSNNPLIALCIVSLITTAVFAYVILRSRWTGWKLILAVFFVFYGVTTVMSQIETAFFVTHLPPGMIPRLFLSGAIIAAVFALLAVLILGKVRSNQFAAEHHERLKFSSGEWLGKLLIIIFVYIVIYFTFGYYIAWKNEAVRAYYNGSDPGSLLAQMNSVVQSTPLLLPLQAVRAILWTLLALPVIRMMKGQWWEAGLAVALLFGVVMTCPLLLPNPFMPEEVRMTHLVETASSNFLFGWLLVLILTWRMR